MALASTALERVVDSVDDAISDVGDGCSVMIGGFGGPGFPAALLRALIGKRPCGLHVICNNADFGGLAYPGGLRKLTCSYPVGPTAAKVLEAVERGEVELEVVPQGTLVERIHAGGAGLGGVLTPTGVGAEFGAGYDVIERDGHRYLLAPPLRADFAFVRATVADRWGNLVFRHASRNFNPVMAMAGRVTVAEVERIVAPGDLDPDLIHTPCAFVDRVVETVPEG
ncbi:MAG: CoA transferase subunit A [Sciscionella sp.]